MFELCMTCSGLDSLRCLDCHDMSKYSPLVDLYPTTELRKPCTPPTAEVVPITNEMHIRGMGSEALAAFIAEIESGVICKGDPRCEADLEEDRLIPMERCHECALAWLKAPYVPKEEAI